MNCLRRQLRRVTQVRRRRVSETGIVGWVFDAVPDAVGIARAAASAVMRKVLPAKTEATERQ